MTPEEQELWDELAKVQNEIDNTDQIMDAVIVLGVLALIMLCGLFLFLPV